MSTGRGSLPKSGIRKKGKKVDYAVLDFWFFLFIQSHSAVKDSSPCCASVWFVVHGHQCLPVAVFMSENSDGHLNLLGSFPSWHFAFGLLQALGGKEVLPPRVGKHIS